MAEIETNPLNAPDAAPGGATLLLLAVALAALMTAAAAFAPPYEGDAYDYSEIALRLVRHGDMLERHLRYFNIPGQNPTHPAAQRANYYSVFSAPFAAVFGETPWTVFIPGLLGVLMVSLAVYLCGQKMFGRAPAWWAALLCLLNPRLIYHALRDPTPETWLAALCLLSACLFLNKRYPASGAALGVGFFVKQSAVALLPAYFLYLLLFDRAEFRRGALWLGLAAFIAAASPFLIRNTVLFRNPLYTEETASRQHFNPQTLRDGNLLRAIFERGDQAADAHPDEAKKSFLVKTLSLTDMNLRDNIIGAQNIDYFPGFLPLIFAACAPLFIAGLILGRASPAVRMSALCIACYLAFHILIVVHFETRYIFPALPFGLLVAAYGAFALGGKFPKFNAQAALKFALITGAIATLPFQTLQTTSPDERVRALEYISACRYLKTNSPADSTLVAWPPFSATFFSDREAVPLVYGGLATQVRVLKKYGVDYVLFNDLMYAGEPPFLDYLTPLAKGRFMSLYRVNSSAEGYKSPEKVYPGLRGYNPLEDVYKRTQAIPIRLDWPLEMYMSKLWGPAAALALMLLAFGAYHFLATRQLKGMRAAGAALLIMFCFGVRILCVLRVHPEEMKPPPVNAMQVRDAAGPDADKLMIIGDKERFADYARELSPQFPGGVIFSPVILQPPPKTALLMPVRERGGALMTADAVGRWREDIGKQIEGRENEAAAAAAALGLLPVRAGGGIVLVPADSRRGVDSFAAGCCARGDYAGKITGQGL